MRVGAGSRARRPLVALAVAVGIALAAAPTLAHHSRAMFDMRRNITYRGVVEEYRWQNPHSHIIVRVGAGAADPATVGTWTVEASSISVMKADGWTPKTYKAGDRITVVAHPNVAGSNLVLLFYAIKPDGTALPREASIRRGEGIARSRRLRSRSRPPARVQLSVSAEEREDEPDQPVLHLEGFHHD